MRGIDKERVQDPNHNIVRIDNGAAQGWQVRLYRSRGADEYKSKYFGDAKYGSPERALLKARKWRDARIRPLEERILARRKGRPPGTTGVPFMRYDSEADNVFAAIVNPAVEIERIDRSCGKNDADLEAAIREVFRWLAERKDKIDLDGLDEEKAMRRARDGIWKARARKRRQEKESS